jgi:hypothetical protein
LSSLLLSKNLGIKTDKIIILPVVFCGCETLSLTLTQEHGSRVYENRMLGKIFGPKREEVAGGWSRMHNEELHNLYTSPSIISEDEIGRSGSTQLRDDKCIQNFDCMKPDRKRSHARLRHKWLDNTGMNLREIRWYGVDWMHLALERDQWSISCEHGNEPSIP